MEGHRKTIRDKQTLKRALNEVELDTIPRHNPLNDTVNLNIDPQISQQDQLQRKNQLLIYKVDILQKTTVKMWNNLCPIVNIIAILSISGMQLGFGIIEITTVFDHISLLDIYKFSTPNGLGLGAIVGFMPLGAILGSIFGRCIIRNMRLKTAHHLVNVVCMVSSFALMQINFPWGILVGRFVYGWCIACYCSWSQRYIHDIAPINLKKVTRSIHSLWVVGSMMLGYFFGLIFYQADVNNYYRIMFCFPGGMALIQLILMIAFVPDSPGQLFQQQLYDEGRKVLEKIYSRQFVDVMVYKYKLQAEVKSLKKIVMVPEEKKKYRYGRFRARFMGLFLNIYRQFIGITTILIYAGFYLQKQESDIAPYANFTLTLIAFIATVASHFLIDRCPRRITMIITSAVYLGANVAVMVGMLISQAVVVFVPMLVAILFYGGTYSTVSSIYPAQILKSERGSYTSLTSWPAMLLVTLIPPIVADVVEPNHTPWPVFLFYAVFCGISALFIGFFAVESKDRQYNDILKQF